MDGELLCKVIQGVKAFLLLPVATLHFAVVAGCVGTDEFMSDTKPGSGSLNVGRSRLVLEKRLVNSKPLSV